MQSIVSKRVVSDIFVAYKGFRSIKVERLQLWIISFLPDCTAF